MKQVLAECRVSCQVTNEDWVLKRAAKVFDANVPAIKIFEWYDKQGCVKTDLNVYLLDEEGGEK